jgi:carbamoyl-phosphate synthase large subunit
MEHIEEAGIHSGDSACSLPPYTLAPAMVTELKAETEAMAKALGVVGLMNVQYAIKDDVIYVLEVNPRASRTVPFVAKATGVAVAKIGARVMAGARLADFNLDDQGVAPHVAVKEAVFPFARFPNVDTILGPEMKSTGEVMGTDDSFGKAYVKAQIAAGSLLPKSGVAFISVNQHDKRSIAKIAADLVEMGFKVVATRGTAQVLRNAGVAVETVYKVNEGRPHIADYVKSGKVNLIINTPLGKESFFDERSIRRAAIHYRIPCITTIAGASAAVAGIRALQSESLGVCSLQEYLKR